MKPFFAPNLPRSGRLIRGLISLVLLASAIALLVALPRLWWLGAALLASAAFVGFEALRGWCALRACGIKTKF